MLQKIIKILFSIWIFICLITNSFAFDANLSVDKNTSDINNPINLRVEISSDEWWQIAITEIKWLENFKKIWQSQSQSSSSEVVIINWKTKQKTTTTINLNLILEAKKAWEFEIWPAILQMWTGTIQTNSVKVKITWNKIQWIWIWNKVLPIQKNTNIRQQNNQNSNKNISNIWNNDEKKEDNLILNKNSSNNNYELYLLILVLVLSSGIFYYLIKNKKEVQEEYESEQVQKQDFISEENREIDFEKKEEKISFPEITDSDFINKIDKIFRQKIAKKFNIKNIETLWNSEILEKLPEQEKISEIIELLNKSKYSKNITDNNKLLELIKNI